jgi:hypothetical protein
MSNFISSIVDVFFPVANAEVAVAHNLAVRGKGITPRGYAVVLKAAPGDVYLAAAPAIPGLGLSANFIGGWEFENGGALGTDSGPNALTLTNNGATQNAGGAVGAAAAFVAASSQYLERASQALLQAGDIDYTIAYWAYLASKTATMVSVSKSSSSVANTSEFFLYYVTGTDRFGIIVYKPGDVVVQLNEASLSPALNTWYFIIGWHDATANTVNIQINNGAVSSLATGGALQAANTAPFDIGRRSGVGSNLYWNGRLDQVLYWKRVLTASERTGLYNSGAGVTVATAIATPAAANEAVWTSTIAYLKASAVGTYRLLFYA